MADRPLDRCRILVIEDEYLLADEVAEELKQHGAVVLGPSPTIARALALMNGEVPLDGAIMDLNLGGEFSFGLADILIDQGIPLVFMTGYDASVLPERLAHVPLCEKPLGIGQVSRALARAIRPDE